MFKQFFPIFFFSLLACGSNNDNNKAISSVSIDRLASNIKELSSDAYEGRAPFTSGEEKTINFIKEKFIAAGLKPANRGSFFQEVSLVQMTNTEKLPLILTQGDSDTELVFGQDIVFWSKHIAGESSISQSELVFVGFGTIAPEYNRNDYAGVDVKGKTVVMFVNDPGFYTQNADIFKGNAMTYYGRWTYKFEEAARQGAVGALIIHETKAAAYGWHVVQNLSRPHFSLLSDHKNKARSTIEGWISNEAARELFTSAGLDMDEALRNALSSDFKAQPLSGIKASAKVAYSIVESKSNNVIGVLPGSERADEVVLFMGHWDHLGVNKNLEGDQVFNGAIDNASGIAAMIELAHQFSALEIHPRRSIVFLAVTAEESGLLGSSYYAENPIYPLSKTIAAINIDGMHAIGKSQDVVVVGFGSSELEDYLSKHAKSQGRYISPESTPEKGIFYRSDHFNFAKRGVPALYTDTGVDIIGKGKTYGNQQIADYTSNRYHQPSDEYDASWDLSGIVQDIELYYLLGRDLANSRDHPNWYEGNEFRAIRDQSLGKK